MASPTTLHPRRACRVERIPWRTSSWSSAIKRRSFFAPLRMDRYRDPNRRSKVTGIDLQFAANLLHAFLHARDTHSNSKGCRAFSILPRGGDPSPGVAHDEFDFLRLADELDFSGIASRMPLYVSQALLNYSEESQFRVLVQSAEFRGYLQSQVDPRSCGKSVRIMAN